MNEPRQDTVIVLHGIGHSRLNMLGTEHALESAGYNVLNLSYPSQKHKIAELAAYLDRQLKQQRIWNNTGKVHFVGHSMGGLLTRHYLDAQKQNLPEEKLGRVVMLGTPNGGSEVADNLQNFPPYKWIFGPAGQELTTHVQKQNAARPYYELGIIAGTLGWPYIMGNFMIPGEHDGRVAVESTKLEGMKDHITLPAPHGLLAWQKNVQRQALHFLSHGRFDHRPNSQPTESG